MKNKLVQSVKATISSIIVALLITVLLLLAIKLFLGRKIDNIFTLANKVSIATNNQGEQAAPVISTDNENEKTTIKNYPEYGTQYATIEIDKIGVNLPVYYGDTLDILKKGVGHSSGSYFPGEGGSIIYDMQLIKETEIDKLPIQRDKEILMVYTCYPFNNVGYATQRYVVYAELEK